MSTPEYDVPKRWRTFMISSVTYKTKLKLDKEVGGGDLSELCTITYRTKLKLDKEVGGGDLAELCTIT